MSSVMRGNFRMAVGGVRGAKWRSLLTMLGVVIGIVAVVTVVGLGEGLKQQVAGSIGRFGNDLITVRPGASLVGENGDIASTDVIFGRSQAGGLGAQDIAAVAGTSSVKLYAPLINMPGIVQAGEQQLHGGNVIATSADLPQIAGQSVSFGSFWDSGQESGNFVVLGADAAQGLFGEPAPLGRSLDFRGESFIVRAVFDRFGDVPLSPTAGFDDSVFIPYQTAERLSDGRADAYALLAKPHNPKRFDETRVDITEELKDLRGGEQDFSVLSPEEHIAATTDVFDLLSTWIMAVAAISLLIGGVGLMNIMLVSVTERMHEIGVRKAVGATHRQIMWQFMMEATVLSVVGGILGIVLSLFAHILLLAYTDLEPVLSWQAVVIAASVSLIIGIVFGTIPAIKAANKDPIEALRHE